MEKQILEGKKKSLLIRLKEIKKSLKHGVFGYCGKRFKFTNTSKQDFFNRLTLLQASIAIARREESIKDVVWYTVDGERLSMGLDSAYSLGEYLIYRETKIKDISLNLKEKIRKAKTLCELNKIEDYYDELSFYPLEKFVTEKKVTIKIEFPKMFYNFIPNGITGEALTIYSSVFPKAHSIDYRVGTLDHDPDYREPNIVYVYGTVAVDPFTDTFIDFVRKAPVSLTIKIDGTDKSEKEVIKIAYDKFVNTSPLQSATDISHDIDVLERDGRTIYYVKIKGTIDSTTLLLNENTDNITDFNSEEEIELFKKLSKDPGYDTVCKFNTKAVYFGMDCKCKKDLWFPTEELAIHEAVKLAKKDIKNKYPNIEAVIFEPGCVCYMHSITKGVGVLATVQGLIPKKKSRKKSKNTNGLYVRDIHI